MPATPDDLDAVRSVAAALEPFDSEDQQRILRINSLDDKKPVFTAKHAPTGRDDHALTLSEWTLKNYIDVAHEIGWISTSAKDVGGVLRDYRNYIHPQKQLSHGNTTVPSGRDPLVGRLKDHCS